MPHTTTQNEHANGTVILKSLPKDVPVYFLICPRIDPKGCSLSLALGRQLAPKPAWSSFTMKTCSPATQSTTFFTPTDPRQSTPSSSAFWHFPFQLAPLGGVWVGYMIPLSPPSSKSPSSTCLFNSSCNHCNHSD